MKQFVLRLINFYQKTHTLHACRFTPTCSAYTYQAIEKYGTINGLLKGLKRILKCHPWSTGGNDPLE